MSFDAQRNIWGESVADKKAAQKAAQKHARKAAGRFRKFPQVTGGGTALDVDSQAWSRRSWHAERLGGDEISRESVIKIFRDVLHIG